MFNLPPVGQLLGRMAIVVATSIGYGAAFTAGSIATKKLAERLGVETTPPKPAKSEDL